jgi:hypothetical protein
MPTDGGFWTDAKVGELVWQAPAFRNLSVWRTVIPEGEVGGTDANRDGKSQ